MKEGVFSIGGIMMTAEETDSEKKSVPVPLCPPLTPQGVSLGSNPGFYG